MPPDGFRDLLETKLTGGFLIARGRLTDHGHATPDKLPLRLVDSRTFGGGVVLLSYGPVDFGGARLSWE